MSLREDLLNGLKDSTVWKIDVDREATVKGKKAIQVRLYCTDRNPSEFTFYKNNKDTTTQQMLSVIQAHLRRKS